MNISNIYMMNIYIYNRIWYYLHDHPPFNPPSMRFGHVKYGEHKTSSRTVERLEYLERKEGIGWDVERGDFHVIEELVKVVRVEDQLDQLFMSEAFPQHDTTIQCKLLILVPGEISRNLMMGKIECLEMFMELPILMWNWQ